MINKRSVSSFKRLTFKVRNKLFYTVGVCLMDISSPSFTDEIGLTFVGVKMTFSRSNKFKATIPTRSNLNLLLITIFTRFNRPLWFFKRCFCTRTVLFSFVENDFRPWDFKWPFIFVSLLKEGSSYAGVFVR